MFRVTCELGQINELTMEYFYLQKKNNGNKFYFYSTLEASFFSNTKENMTLGKEIERKCKGSHSVFK